MSQGQSPETQIGGRVRDGTEHILNGVDGLVDVDFAHRLVIVTMSTSGVLLVSREASGQRSLTFGQFNVAGQLTIVVGLSTK